MEAKDMKKFTISNLVLIVLSDKYPDSLRKYAEIELRRRFRNVAWDINDFIDKENKKIEKRGLDINNYLFSKNLDMQKLMEVYFLYYYGYSQNEDDLLFSEKHICGMSSSVFREILKNEIANLEARIILDNDKNNLKLLEIFKLALEKKAKTIINSDCHNPKELLDDAVKSTYDLAKKWGISPLTRL